VKDTFSRDGMHSHQSAKQSPLAILAADDDVSVDLALATIFDLSFAAAAAKELAAKR